MTDLFSLKLVLRSFLGLAVIALAACGGSDGDDFNDDATTVQRTGTVGLLLTDKPADPAIFAAINASIESADLLGGDDDERVNLYSGPTLTYDLLKLRNESVPFTFSDEVPEGEYCKIRLTLSDLELVLADDTPMDPDDNETVHPRLPGNGKLDLVVRDCFSVSGGEVVTIELDIDAGKSIHVNQNNKGFKFRPVIFVNVLDAEFNARLVRLSGEIRRVDPENNRLLLCDAVPFEHMDGDGCAAIRLGEQSAFFDNLEFDGEPRPLSELLSEDKIGEMATVVGRPGHRVDSYRDVEVPEDYYPLPGECRLWQVDLPPAQQDDPVDCDTLTDELPAGSFIVDHDGPRDNPWHSLMLVDGVAVELGEFQRVAGEIDSDASADGFTMDVNRSAPPIDDDEIDVLFQQGGADFNGTRILSKAGRLLEADELVEALHVQVDGVIDEMVGMDKMLKAALVIVDGAVDGDEQVTGTILSAGEESILVDPDAASVCGIETNELEVELSDDAEITTVTITDEGSLVEPGGVPAEGQSVGMNGECDDDGYETDNLVIVDDQRDL